MASRSQKRPPSSLTNRKDNLGEEPPIKRRKIGVGKMVVSATNRPSSRARQVLSAINGVPDLGPDSTLTAGVGSECGSSVSGIIEFNSREDVERLLNEKMRGKNKTDYKGRSEQMMEYIKKLRSCIKWFQELEDGYMLEIEKIRTMLEDEERKCVNIEALMKKMEDELNAAIEKLKLDLASLEKLFKKEEAEKLAAMESYNKEKEIRVIAENSRNALSEDLRKTQQHALNADQQIKSMQDINKRLQDYNTSLQQYNSRLQNDTATYNEANARLQKEKCSMMEEVTNLRSHSNILQDQLNSSRMSLQETTKEKEELKHIVEGLKAELQQVRDDRNLQLAQVQSLGADLSKYKEFTGKSSVELEKLINKTDVLEVTCSSQQEKIRMLQVQLDSANARLQMADSSVLETRIEYEEQQRHLKDLTCRLADAELKIIDGEKLRKKLHNTILELKGNIRVFCRVRPLLNDRDCSGKEVNVVSYPSSIESLGRGIELMHNSKKHTFTFDKVFDHEATQDDVFVEISQLVQSALDGYKVCIFAYGQTGSGKTYTMMGRHDAAELKGLIPRSLEQIFQTSQSLSSQGWRYKMQASMLEIYNETIRDLLVTNRLNGFDSSGAGGKQYTIKHDPDGNTYVSDLTIVDVCSFKEVSYLLKQAAQSRSVGRTQMNEQSSRSHFVFILRISGVNESTEQHVEGVLNLIDLAGSERLDKSGSTGERLKETQYINKSLLALSDVISAIAKKEDHVPFRNSKLTYLLQPCLGGESKTLMFVNISPESLSTGESRCSLQFASKVNSCEIGVARRHAQMRPIDSSRLGYN